MGVVKFLDRYAAAKVGTVRGCWRSHKSHIGARMEKAICSWTLSWSRSLSFSLSLSARRLHMHVRGFASSLNIPSLASDLCASLNMLVVVRECAVMSVYVCALTPSPYMPRAEYCKRSKTKCNPPAHRAACFSTTSPFLGAQGVPPQSTSNERSTKLGTTDPAIASLDLTPWSR